MRVHLKGVVVVGVSCMVVVVMVVQHMKNQQHRITSAKVRQVSGSGERSKHGPGLASSGGVSARAQAPARQPKKSPKAKKGGNSPGSASASSQEKTQPLSSAKQSSSLKTAQQEQKYSEPPLSGHQSAGTATSHEEKPPSKEAPSNVTRDVIPSAGASADVISLSAATRDATLPAQAPSSQDSSEVKTANEPNKDSQKSKPKMDIRTVDPLSATEPLVIRQQEELEQQRFGFQPWRGRPKPPEKLEDPSKSWLTDLNYPQWYLDSVKKSVVYGKEKEMVEGNPLYTGECKNATNVRAQFAAEEVQTFSYVEPGEFIGNSKNPCWYEEPVKKKQMRCLPYFYVAGVAKCGTTDLYKRIRLHPHIMQGELKEYHWWDRLRYGAPMELKFTKDSERNDRPLPLALYSRIIMGDEVEEMKAELRKNQSERICGDGSPSYLWDPRQWHVFEGNEGCTEPKIVIGSFIQHANPKSKIILIFRQPTQRLYSRFLSRRDSYPPFRHATAQTFHEYVVKGVALYKACFQRYSIRECAYNKTLYDEAVIRIVEGLYSVFMEDWLRIFNREQILILRNEDYSDDIEGHMLKVFNFLGAAKLGQSEMRPILTHVSTNIGQNYGKVGPMLPETIAILNEFYKPFVLRLHELIGDDRFLWKDIAVT